MNRHPDWKLIETPFTVSNPGELEVIWKRDYESVTYTTSITYAFVSGGARLRLSASNERQPLYEVRLNSYDLESDTTMLSLRIEKVLGSYDPRDGAEWCAALDDIDPR